MTRSLPRVLTTFVYPPIPDRRFDYQAHYEGEEDEQMDVGHGRTAAEAVVDLLENYPRGVECERDVPECETDFEQGKEGWVCPQCGLARGPDLHDPCIGNLPGIMFACCGHGGRGHCGGYLYFENGVRLGVIVTSVDYDDDRPRIEIPGAPQ